jgi:hypothetical protein
MSLVLYLPGIGTHETLDPAPPNLAPDAIPSITFLSVPLLFLPISFRPPPRKERAEADGRSISGVSPSCFLGLNPQHHLTRVLQAVEFPSRHVFQLCAAVP